MSAALSPSEWVELTRPGSKTSIRALSERLISLDALDEPPLTPLVPEGPTTDPTLYWSWLRQVMARVEGVK